MWLPIVLAYFTAVITLPGYLPFSATAVATIGFTVQPLVGAWLLRQFGSDGTVYRTEDVIRFVTGALLIAGIGPLFNTAGQITLHALSEAVWLTFTRAWAGGVLGILIVTPLIVAWHRPRTFPLGARQRFEAAGALTLLSISSYLLFWTSFSQAYSFLLIFLLCVSLFWIAIRLDARSVTSSLALLTIIGIMGSIVSHPVQTPLNQLLFSDELFIIVLVPVFLTFFSMVEERRQAELLLAGKVSELEYITEQLSENDRAKNEFIAILAHELRNPLSTTLSTLELLKLENLQPSTKTMIERGEQQTHAMRRLLDDLLDVARITERKFNISTEVTTLQTIMERCLLSCETFIQSKGHTLVVSLPDKDVPILVDPIRIEQVITNLLNNAAKYTPHNGRITLSTTLQDTWLQIEVSDNGRGIPLSQLEKIFAPFQQLGPAPHRTSGIGIGLFLTRQIVAMHGGTITAHSDGQHRGSRFTVVLPMSDESVVTAPTTSKEHGEDVMKTEKTHRILIVDDNEAAATGIFKILTFKGHQTHMVHSGTDALTAVHSFSPTVILLDIGLPDLSGYEVAKRIRAGQTHADVTLIALTGYGQREDKAEAFAAGCNYHLTKPVSITEIEAILEKLDGIETRRNTSIPNE
jgi:signal transduction histidine kinase/ActR/RegA family two-component response regulator